MNTNPNDKKLFEVFGPSSREEWIEKATADLKGADFDKRLVWKNLNDIAIQPFYSNQKDRTTLSETGTNASNLINYRRIQSTEVKVMNESANKAVEEGMNGLIFEITESVDPAVLLSGLNLETTVVSFEIQAEGYDFAFKLAEYLKSQGISTTKLKGSVDIKLFDNLLTRGVLSESDLDFQAKLIELFQNYPEFRTVMVSGKSYTDAGSNQVQEIAYTMNSMVYLLDELAKRKVQEDHVFANLIFSMGISSDYFIEIAKLRTFISLVKQVSKKYDQNDFKVLVSSKTSIWSKSVTDAHTNMLRATTEAMSAILGNAEGVEVDPFNSELEEVSDFSNRIAGNVVTILKEESYFGKVANPTDGSYYIEEVSFKLAEKALELFKQIEQSGGFIKVVKDGTLQNQIAEIRQTKIKYLSQRRQAMVGVNKYPNLMESVSKNSLNNQIDSQEDSKLLVPRRAGLELEYIRFNTEKFVEEKGFRPSVEIISFGNLGMRKARAAFAFDFMGVSGYSIEDEKPFNEVLEAAEAGAQSASSVVVICSSDKDYQEQGLAFVKNFRAANSDKILLLAGNPEGIQEELLTAGLDGFIHVRSDICDTLNDIQQKLSKTVKPLEI